LSAADRLDVASTRTLRLLLGGAAVVVISAGLKVSSGIVAPLVLALTLTIVFHPLRYRLGRHMPDWLASFVLLLAVYLMLLAFVLALVVSLGRLAELLPTYKSQLDERASALGDWLESLGVGADRVEAMGQSVDPTQLAGVAGDLLGSLFGALTNFAFVVTLLFFLVFDGSRMQALMDGARHHRPHLVDALASFAGGTRSYLAVSAAFGSIVAVIDTLALWAMGVPGAFIWGVLAFVTNFIPNVGFVIGVVPPALIALLEGGPGLMLGVIVVYSVINFVIQSLIQPRYVGSAVGLAPSLTFLSLVFWGWILGPLGALLAVPMSLLARALLVEADPGARWALPLVSGRPEDLDHQPSGSPAEGEASGTVGR
jgi:predicted PurR-regulated permease PerM